MRLRNKECDKGRQEERKSVDVQIKSENERKIKKWSQKNISS